MLDPNSASNWGSNRAPTIRSLICSGLGYCCPWAFFSLHKRTALIATRLGCSKRAIQEWKARFRACEISCEHHETCLSARLDGKPSLAAAKLRNPP